jgi:DeoR family transcriptional regulator of aga operon
MRAGGVEESPRTDAPRLLTEERRRAILEIVNRQGNALISELARKFAVSAVTIRADINALSEKELVVRSHGGAIRRAEVALDAPLDVKAGLHHDEKVRIGKAAASLVNEGEIILLDSGTTTLEAARALTQRSFSRLTVVTHSLNIAWELSGFPQISMIVIGGVLRQISRSFVGPQAQRMLADLHVDHFFLAVDGLEPELGPSTPDILEAELNATMISLARQVTVLTDSSKIGRRSLSRIAPITSIHRIITDTAIRPEHRAVFESKGIEVIAV